MSSGKISVDPAEAQSVINTINRESENAKTAIRNVMKSRDSLTNFQGPRAVRFKQETQDEMSRLTNAMQVIDECAKKLKMAVDDIVRAGT